MEATKVAQMNLRRAESNQANKVATDRPTNDESLSELQLEEDWEGSSVNAVRNVD